MPTSFPSVGSRASRRVVLVITWFGYRGFGLLVGGTIAAFAIRTGGLPTVLLGILTAPLGLCLLLVVGGLFRMSSFGRLVAMPLALVLAVIDGSLAVAVLSVGSGLYAAVDVAVFVALYTGGDAFADTGARRGGRSDQRG